MDVRTGCDIVYIPRFEKALAQAGVKERLFTEEELGDIRPEHLAGIFAAKEAVLKAIGFKPDAWKELSIKKSTAGAPFVAFHSNIGDRINQIHISISHDGDYAMAVAVAQLTTEDD